MLVVTKLKAKIQQLTEQEDTYLELFGLFYDPKIDN